MIFLAADRPTSPQEVPLNLWLEFVFKIVVARVKLLFDIAFPIVGSTLTISNTPNDYSRVQVFVNGQLQNLGDGVKTTDCYFSATGSVAKSISNIVSGDTLYWNGVVAGFRLTTTDTVAIAYEV